METITVRRARPDEAELLTAMMLRAKAWFGHAEEALAAWREALAFTPARMAAWDIRAAEVDGALAGAIALRYEGEEAELEAFFVDPRQHGVGVGLALIEAFVGACHRRGVRRVGAVVDPSVEQIYTAIGFQAVEAGASGRGPSFPRMELTIEPCAYPQQA